MCLQHFVRAVKVGCTVLLTVVLIVAVSVYVSGNRLYSVQTGSMVPTFKPGDAVLVHRVSPHTLAVGMVITFHDPRQPNRLLTHRIVAINEARKQVTTRGDNLKVADPPLIDDFIVGMAWAVAPNLGRLMNKMHTPAGLAILVYLPAFSIVCLELAPLFRRPQVVYRLRHSPS